MTSESSFIIYHAYGERVDAFDVQETVLPGNETLHVDVQLVPDRQDGLIVLLVPLDNTEKIKLYLKATSFSSFSSPTRTANKLNLSLDPEL